jgi:hypothetical protein
MANAALREGLDRLLAVLEAEGEAEDAETVRGFIGGLEEPKPKPASKKATAKKEG